jgi:hypothetical protein
LSQGIGGDNHSFNYFYKIEIAYMNFLLRAFLIRRSRDKGFAIPMVIALGLIMLLLGIASIYKSSDQKDIATTQRKTSEALSVAEAGVAHYLEFLQRNSVLATYAYSDTNWNNAALATCDKSNNLPVAVSDFDDFTNQNVNGDPDKQYRLVSYSYEDGQGNVVPDGTPPPSTNNTIGVLQVEGRSRLGDNFATAKLRVEIPVRPENMGVNYAAGVSPLASYAHNPTLWIGEYDNSTNIGNLQIRSYGAAVTPLNPGEPSLATQFPNGGNIVISRPNSLTVAEACKLPTGGTAPTPDRNLQSPTTQRIIADPRTMPPSLVPSNVAPSTYKIINNTHLRTLTKDPNNDAKVIVTPVAGENETYYHYTFGDPTAATRTNLVLNGSANSFSTMSGTKTILYLNGDLTLRNGASINPPGVNPLPPSSYLEIYGGPNTTKIKFEGTQPITINAFIHAPNATVEVDNNLRLDITGAMWVKNWINRGTLAPSSNITPDTTFNSKDNLRYQSNIFYSTSSSIAPKPTIFPPTKWETVEAN